MAKSDSDFAAPIIGAAAEVAKSVKAAVLFGVDSREDVRCQKAPPSEPSEAEADRVPPSNDDVLDLRGARLEDRHQRAIDCAVPQSPIYVDGADARHPTVSRASVYSWTRSRQSSIPTDTRTNPEVTPAASSSAASISECVVVAG